MRTYTATSGLTEVQHRSIVRCVTSKIARRLTMAQATYTAKEFLERLLANPSFL